MAQDWVLYKEPLFICLNIFEVGDREGKKKRGKEGRGRSSRPHTRKDSCAQCLRSRAAGGCLVLDEVLSPCLGAVLQGGSEPLLL